MFKSENSITSSENSISKMNIQETKSRERSSHLLNNSRNRNHNKYRFVKSKIIIIKKKNLII